MIVIDQHDENEIFKDRNGLKPFNQIVSMISQNEDEIKWCQVNHFKAKDGINVEN